MRNKLMSLTFDLVGNKGSPMTIIDGMKAYAEPTQNCMPTVGVRYLVRLRYIDRDRGFMIFTPIRPLEPLEPDVEGDEE